MVLSSRIVKSLAAPLVLAALVAVTGCQTAPTGEGTRTAFRSEAVPRTTVLAEREPVQAGRLTGRTIAVRNAGDIQLRAKEVVLTFDDGPAGGRTDRILDTLKENRVKATFFIVGQMAVNRPDLVRRAVREGHSIGSHTWGHPNLARTGHSAAIAEIRRGEDAVRRAGGGDPAFFRFPYLADTKALRTHLAGRGVTVIDVDVDSHDYLKSSPAAVIDRTMRRLRAKGRGVILMHDLHSRTAAALPGLMRALKAEGYKVVHLVPASQVRQRPSEERVATLFGRNSR